jgi:hypothetical protein
MRLLIIVVIMLALAAPAFGKGSDAPQEWIVVKSKPVMVDGIVRLVEVRMSEPHSKDECLYLLGVVAQFYPDRVRQLYRCVPYKGQK